jgi:ribosomal protein S12 methylthiotransferase accessory factor
MKLKKHNSPTTIRRNCMNLLSKTVSRICGVNQEAGFFHKGSTDFNLVTTGVELTGIHELLNRVDPGFGGYHIGGMGLFQNEALIKGLGESLERYSQLIGFYTVQKKFETRFCTQLQLMEKGQTSIDEKFLNVFLKEQYLHPSFPFEKFERDSPLLWICVKEYFSKRPMWIPAQFVVLGYNVNQGLGEKPLFSAVTTGTAVHSSPQKAILNSVLELSQIDAAMGHWYGNSPSFQIKMDASTKTLSKIISDRLGKCDCELFFTWLPSSDLPITSVACTIKRENSIPKIAIGLGCDMNVELAMYKAFLEAAGTSDLAKVSLLYDNYSPPKTSTIDSSSMYDLDSNVLHYAKGSDQDIIHKKFIHLPHIQASDIPSLTSNSVENDLKLLVSAFEKTHKNLFFMDLTCNEMDCLNLYSSRVWSPELLSLSLPSAAHQAHPRYNSYGGISYRYPHPYP